MDPQRSGRAAPQPTPAGPDVAGERRRLEGELRRACLRRLQRDWRACNWAFLGGQLTAPAFRLDRVGSRWGQWEPRGRVISLSERLVLDHPWTAVLEVLRHEMAHQVVHELFRLVDAPDHGEAFRRACSMLGIEAVACGDPLSVFEVADQGGPDVPRLRKVRRLLALAESPNLHEAEAALAKANELLLRYNLDLLEARGERRYRVRHLGPIAKRRSKASLLVGGIISEHFFCEAIWIDSFCPRTGHEGRVLEISGTPENVELAAYTYEELLRTADELWRRHKRASGIPGDRDRRRYVEGVLVGFDEKLARERRRCAAERALVWRGDPKLRAFFRRRHPRVRSEGVGVRGGEAFEAGREAGRDLRLRKAMPGRPQERGLMLESERAR
jgi:hypothetical protein